MNTMDTELSRISSFPHVSSHEFEDACTALHRRFQTHLQDEWHSVQLLRQYDILYMRIFKPLLPNCPGSKNLSDPDCLEGETEVEEPDDEEALHTLRPSEATIEYDVALSPIYQVPVLYFRIKDILHRYPITMDTLYQYIIPPSFKTQAESVGIIGGITITDHPITHSPVFFIHPCQTEDVMKATVGHREVSPEEYLIIWIGALGKFVSLDVPLSILDTKN